MPSRAERWRRYAALGAAILRARRGPYDPFKLTWILTEHCSLRCGPCQLWARDPQAGPDLATVRAVLDANPQLTWLNLSGGDLVERHDAPAILDEVARRLPDLALLDFPTAGQDERGALAALAPLLDSDIPRIYVSVSLDGPDEVHDRVRGRRGAARRARATLARLSAIRRPGLSVVAGLTLSSANTDAATRHAPARLVPQGVRAGDLHLNIAHDSTHYYRNARPAAPDRDGALAVLRHVTRARGLRLDALGLVERRYAALARRYLRDGDAGQACGALRASVFLGADLRVYPCTLHDRPLGRLSEIGYALRRIPEWPLAARVLREVETRACPRCWSPCEAFPTLLLNLGRPA